MAEDPFTGPRRRLVEIFLAEFGKTSDPQELSRILLELDVQDERWHPPMHRLVAKFVAAGLSAAFLLGGVFVESLPHAALLLTAGAIGWAAFVYDTLGQKAAEFGANLAGRLRSRR